MPFGAFSFLSSLGGGDDAGNRDCGNHDCGNHDCLGKDRGGEAIKQMVKPGTLWALQDGGDDAGR